MFIIFMLVLAFVLVRLFTSIWLQIWLDNGDGQGIASTTKMLIPYSLKNKTSFITRRR